MIIENITEFRYNLGMNLRELITDKNITIYGLCKETGIPYTTINDLVNNKTSIQNIYLKHAYKIAKALNVSIEYLIELETPVFIEFRYFRNNVLHELKAKGDICFINEIIKNKEIDYYYKNDGKEYALYLLALIDYLSRLNNIPIYEKRYNNLRKEKLDKPFFVGSDLITFSSVDEAEEMLKIEVIPEFRKFNIIEEDVYNVA